MKEEDIVIVGAARTPVGSFNGALSDTVTLTDAAVTVESMLRVL